MTNKEYFEKLKQRNYELMEAFKTSNSPYIYRILASNGVNWSINTERGHIIVHPDTIVEGIIEGRFCVTNITKLSGYNIKHIYEPTKITKPNAVEQNEIFKSNLLLKQPILQVYHGTKNKHLVPDFNYNNANNDYGKGFYTTPDKELGKEWAYAKYNKDQKAQGFLYTYQIDITGLNVLNFTEYDSLHWLAELLTHRTLNLDGKEALIDVVEQVKNKYKLYTDNTDIIVGYRADDSYFRYAEDFVSGFIYRDTFDKALRYGNLGLQVFIKSERAFNNLIQVGEIEKVPIKYYNEFNRRDINATEEYKRQRKNQTSRLKQRIYDFL